MQPGRVLSVEIESSRPAFGGRSFGAAGRFSLQEGWARMQADPGHELNRGLVHLEHAPRNASGQVEYAVQVCVLAPEEAGRANGWLLCEVPNRGNKLVFGRMCGQVAVNDLAREEAACDGWLLEQGFAFAWCAWQGDLRPGNHRMLARLPVATRGGLPITGPSRDEFILEPSPTNDAIVELHPERFVARLSYPAARMDAADGRITVRQRERDARQAPPGLSFRYVDASHIEVRRPAGFDPGALYEFVYLAKDPVVMGLGLAALRDFALYLRSGNLVPPVRHAIAFGTSQSGRLLRDFLHLGFNEDGEGKKVFEGVLPVVTGARRSFTNFAFAQPGRFSRQHEDHLYPGDEAPFGYGELLERAATRGVAPKIAHLEVETEFWAGRSSLLATDASGRDLSQPDNVRLYLAAGIPHATVPPPPGVSIHAHNVLPYGTTLRAVLRALMEWVASGRRPPDSVFPSRAAGTLVPFEAARAAFPAIPGVVFPPDFNRLRAKDRSTEPPGEGAEVPLLVPRPDADGNSGCGIPHPLLLAPVGTLTGWMVRGPGFAEGDLYSIVGSFFPFAATRAQREARGDPRPSLEERYGSPERWAAEVARGIERLVQERFIVPEDAPGLIAAARRGWDIANFAGH